MSDWMVEQIADDMDARAEKGSVSADYLRDTTRRIRSELRRGMMYARMHETETMYLSDESYRHGATVAIHVLKCSICRHRCEYVSEGYEYCPHCGSRVTNHDV